MEFLFKKKSGLVGTTRNFYKGKSQTDLPEPGKTHLRGSYMASDMGCSWISCFT